MAWTAVGMTGDRTANTTFVLAKDVSKSIALWWLHWCIIPGMFRTKDVIIIVMVWLFYVLNSLFSHEYCLIIFVHWLGSCLLILRILGCACDNCNVMLKCFIRLICYAGLPVSFPCLLTSSHVSSPCMPWWKEQLWSSPVKRPCPLCSPHNRSSVWARGSLWSGSQQMSRAQEPSPDWCLTLST